MCAATETPVERNETTCIDHRFSLPVEDADVRECARARNSDNLFASITIQVTCGNADTRPEIFVVRKELLENVPVAIEDTYLGPKPISANHDEFWRTASPNVRAEG